MQVKTQNSYIQMLPGLFAYHRIFEAELNQGSAQNPEGKKDYSGGRERLDPRQEKLMRIKALIEMIVKLIFEMTKGVKDAKAVEALIMALLQQLLDELEGLSSFEKTSSKSRDEKKSLSRERMLAIIRSRGH